MQSFGHKSSLRHNSNHASIQKATFTKLVQIGSIAIKKTYFTKVIQFCSMIEKMWSEYFLYILNDEVVQFWSVIQEMWFEDIAILSFGHKSSFRHNSKHASNKKILLQNLFSFDQHLRECDLNIMVCSHLVTKVHYVTIQTMLLFKKLLLQNLFRLDQLQSKKLILQKLFSFVQWLRKCDQNISYIY